MFRVRQQPECIADREADRIAVRRHRLLRWIALVSNLVLAAGIAGLPVYVHPQVDQLRHADAIMILGGYKYDRYVLGFQLGSEGWAPNVVASNPIGPDDPWLTDYCKKPNRDYKLYCIIPNPRTTAGETQALNHLATVNHWHSIIVVTFTPQISRARFILQQCLHAQLIMVASGPQPSLARWIYEYPYQTAGYVKALLDPAC
ncbi:hypothetical protein [Mycobacterium sp. OTB74]|uniref:YdcF family protein n=1 Tax=Mycobacterium sp. OTB74 TaxID=1853452 RepID=UPI00247684A7|nr:hypothetical protein [Mycobacterium sp. OTB74]MDH6242420.1 uncharacterized SAM-binding protein YcdF (DUF218 family) [Mycobacterium sp. OTB74]